FTRPPSEQELTMAYDNPGGLGGYPPPPGAYPPPPPGGPGGPTPPNTHLVMAILTTILCCLPLGVVSIVYATQVNSKWAAGDYQGAMAASESARKWWLASLISGIVLIVLWLLFVVAL